MKIFVLFILCFTVSKCYNYDCKPCKCLIDNQEIVANCNRDNKNEPLQEIPKIIDAKSNIIKFEGQILTHFKKDEFVKFNNLTKCYFNRNKITEIANGTFRSLKKLTRLDLSHNYISSFDFFDEFTNLEYLDLANNKITILHDKSLYYLRNLSELHLENNLIENIAEKTFNNLKKISVIDLSGNKLQNLQLPQNTITLKQFILHDNPWNCSYSSCELRETSLSKNWLTIIPTCDNPTTYKNLKWTELHQYKPVITVNKTGCTYDLICTFESCPVIWDNQEITDIGYEGYNTILHLPNKNKYNGNYTCIVIFNTYGTTEIEVDLTDLTTPVNDNNETTTSNQVINETEFDWPDFSLELSLSINLIIIIIIIVIFCSCRFCLGKLICTTKFFVFNCLCCAKKLGTGLVYVFRQCATNLEEHSEKQQNRRANNINKQSESLL